MGVTPMVLSVITVGPPQPRQTPCVQVAVAAHTLPHAPQFALSVDTFTHFVPQAFGVAPLHEREHALPAHIALPVPALGPGHTPHVAPAVPLPHACVFCAVVTQPPALQQPPAHELALHATHAPAWQMSPAVPHGSPSSTGAALRHWGPWAQDCWPT
jgi:hypothetical protein